MVQTFTVTCGNDYDRHLYKIVTKDGAEFFTWDYNYLRHFWYQNSKHLSHVEVVDDPDAERRGLYLG